MYFAYLIDGTLVAFGRQGEGDELTGQCSTQLLIWGVEDACYTAPGGILTPLSATEVATLRVDAEHAQLLQICVNDIDAKTEELIKTGWRYPDASGQQIRLEQDDQINFEGDKNDFVEMEADGVDVSPYFPMQIKVWTGERGEAVMLSINDLSTYKDFVRAGKAHKRTMLREGYFLKNSLSTMTFEELKAWEDPR